MIKLVVLGVLAAGYLMAGSTTVEKSDEWTQLFDQALSNFWGFRTIPDLYVSHHTTDQIPCIKQQLKTGRL